MPKTTRWQLELPTTIPRIPLRYAGKKSEEIETLLGYTFGDEIIHRNNLVIL